MAEYANLAGSTDPNQHGPLSRSDMKIIDLIDCVNYLIYVTQVMQVDAKSVHKVKKPEPYPRPGLVGGKSAAKVARQVMAVRQLREKLDAGKEI